MSTAGGHLRLVAADVARLATATVRAAHGSAITAHTKSTPTDVVTQTDIESEQLIRGELLSRCPGSSILGEEFGDEVGVNRVGWIVDPIDGTVNFLYGLPVVSVSIAATIGGEVVAGAVADVLSGTTFSAARGDGAWHDDVPITCSTPDTLEMALIGTGFSYDSATRAEQAETLRGLLPNCRDIRCMGSAALNLCWVGAGLLDAYFERDLKVYDWAAGALIASEAGAQVITPHDGNEPFMLAAAPPVFDSLAAIVRPDGET